MVSQYFWWIAAAVLVGVEMVTGTFYLLVVAVACLIGGLVALAGLDTAWQWAVAAVFEVVGTYILYRWKRTRRVQPRLSNNLDVGQRVRVLEWRADGSARVSYRGSQWEAVLEDGSTPQREQMVIVAMRGAQLVLGPVPA